MHSTDNEKSIPPSWATGDQSKYQVWYFENEHGEQWVARREKDLLRIAGLDIGWKEIQLNAEQVMAEKERLQQEILLRQVMKIPELKKDGRSVPANSAFSYEYDT